MTGFGLSTIERLRFAAPLIESQLSLSRLEPLSIIDQRVKTRFHRSSAFEFRPKLRSEPLRCLAAKQSKAYHCVSQKSL